MSRADDRVGLKNCIIRAVRNATGMREHLAVPVAEEILFSLCRDVGGSEVYIPSERKYRTRVRNESILQQFNGMNYAQLAQEHSLTERQVRRIIEKK